MNSNQGRIKGVNFTNQSNPIKRNENVMKRNILYCDKMRRCFKIRNSNEFFLTIFLIFEISIFATTFFRNFRNYVCYNFFRNFRNYNVCYDFFFVIFETIMIVLICFRSFRADNVCYEFLFIFSKL